VANTKTAKKQLLITKRNHERNVHFKTMLKNALKKARTAITEARSPRPRRPRSARPSRPFTAAPTKA